MSNKDVLQLSPVEILGIDVNDPEKLFNLKTFTKDYRRLLMQWHPDRSTHHKAAKLSAHISEMKENGQRRIDNGTWREASEFIFVMTGTGVKYQLKYLRLQTFELGRLYISHETIIYVIAPEHKDLFENGINAIRNIQYPNPDMEKHFKHLLPELSVYGETTDGDFIAVMKKERETVLLSEVIGFVPENKIHPKQVAWMLSRLFNLCVFLDFIGVCHNSILTSTVFVNVEKHTCFLFGGWWYATAKDTKLKALPAPLLRVLPDDVRKKKIAKTKYDQVAVKGLGISCLGDPTMIGSKLLKDDSIPLLFRNWIRLPPEKNALQTLKGWDKTLIKIFGKRKFVKFEPSISKLY